MLEKVDLGIDLSFIENFLPVSDSFHKGEIDSDKVLSIILKWNKCINDLDLDSLSEDQFYYLCRLQFICLYMIKLLLHFNKCDEVKLYFIKELCEIRSKELIIYKKEED